MPKQRSLASKSVVVTAGSVTNVALGFAFQIILARELGLDWLVDAYSLGTMVPTLLATVLVGSAPSVLVPAFSREARSSDKFSLGMLWPATVLVFAITLVSAGGFAVAAPALDTGGGQPYELIQFGLIASAAIPLSWVVGVCQAVLLTHERFFWVGFSAAINGAGLLLAALVAFAVGATSTNLAVAFVCGYALQAVVLSIVASSHIRWRRNSASELVTRSLLLLLGSALIYKSQPIIERVLAAYEAGGPAVFNYAGKISQAVLMASTLGLSLISLPLVSRHAAAGEPVTAWRNAQAVTTWIASFSAPLVVVGIFHVETVIRVLFGNDTFSPEGIDQVSSVMRVLLVGVYFSAVSGPTVNLLYALGRYRFVATVSVTTTVFALAFALLLRPVWGLPGIAAGGSIAFVVNYLIYTFVAARASGGTWFREEGRRQLFILVTVVATGGLYALATSGVSVLTGDSLLGLVLAATIAAATSALSAVVVRRLRAFSVPGSR